LYEDLLESGIAKECARRILPLCTPTTIFMQGTLRSWLHYIDLRAGVETQLEHRQIAEQCKTIFCEQFPVIGEAYWPNQAGDQ
jgi:thymidylate synthase (FAD)